jgi:acetoin utilization deacetylase AcuC-like enzyme
VTWLRLLGDEGVSEPLRGELWRHQHPELAERIARLVRRLEEAGIRPDRWPHPAETAQARDFQLAVMVIKATDGYEAVIDALERRWAKDRRNPAATLSPDHLRPGRPAWTGAVFDEHWAAAVAETAPPHKIADVALAFRALNGDVGVDPEHLRRLRRRRQRGNLAE